jgi:hypothetical protein
VAAAQLGLAAWFFGNLYESVVNLPAVLAERGQTRLWDPGSPVRYYSPAVPPTLAALTMAVRQLRRGDTAPAMATAAAGPAAAIGLTGYLVPMVNHRLMGDEPLSSPERHRLVATWHQLNAARLASLASGALALRRAARS